MSSCLPLTTLMGSVLSCPCRGEFSLLSLLIAHSKTNPFISKTQGRGFQAPLCAKLFCPGSRRARGSLPHWRPVGFLPIPAQFPALADPLIFQSFNLQGPPLRSCSGQAWGRALEIQIRHSASAHWIYVVNEPDRKGRGSRITPALHS